MDFKMRVIENIKFAPFGRDGMVEGYLSRLEVEISGQFFKVERFMPLAEYESTYPVLRDFIHDSLRTDIMTQIRKKLFEGVV